jgi:O-antigen ligase
VRGLHLRVRQQVTAGRGLRTNPASATGPVSGGPQATTTAGRRRAPGRVKQGDTPLLKDPFRLAMLALIVQTISKFSSFVGVLAVLRPALILFAFCLLFALANPTKVFGDNILRFSAPKLILVQAAIACASCVFGISLGNAATFVINVYWKTIVFALLLMTSLHTLSDVRRTVWATAAAGMILGFISVFIVHISKSSGAEQYDANDIGLIMVMTIPLVLLLLQTSGKTGRIVSLIGLALIAATIVKSSSRGAFVGGSCVGIALLIFLPGISVVKRVFFVFGIVATMAWFAPPGYWTSMSNLVSDPKADYNWTDPQGRREIAKRGVGYMMQYPVFGIGINNFAMAEGTISPYAQAMANTDVGVKWSAPHNSWVEAAAETGIPGLLVWAALVVGSAGSLLRLRRKMPKAWATSGNPDQRFVYLSTLYVPIAFIGFVVCGTFVSFAWSDQSYILPAIAMGLQKVVRDHMPPAAQPARSGSSRMRGQRVRRPVAA